MHPTLPGLHTGAALSPKVPGDGIKRSMACGNFDIIFFGIIYRACQLCAAPPAPYHVRCLVAMLDGCSMDADWCKSTPLMCPIRLWDCDVTVL